MIGYVTLGTNDLERAERFYEALLGEIGAKQIMSDDRMRFYGTQPAPPLLAICRPENGKPASVGSGVMVGIDAGSREAVDRLHAKALELGGSDEGAPGPRGETFYGGYFRDLDGNKLVAYVMG